MKKIFLLTLLFLASNIFAQFQYFRIGSTKIVDTTGYASVNKSLLLYQNLRVKGYIDFDTTSAGKISFVGNDLKLENTKNYGGIQIWLGNKTPQIFINKLQDGFPGYWTIGVIDSTGIDLFDAEYKINGVAITGGSGSANLYGYGYKDSVNYWLQHNKFKSFTIYGSGSDSVQFQVKGGTGDYMVTPTGSIVTFGSTHGTGSKSVYAGEYYRGTTLLTTYYNTNTTFSNIPYLDKKNTFSALNEFTGTDSSITAKGVKGYTGQDRLKLLSPGSGTNGMNIYNTTSSDQVVVFTGNGAALYTFGNNYLYLGDGTTGKPLISHDAPTTSAVSYSFYGDRNTGLMWNSGDNISMVTGGTARVTYSTTLITATLPLSITGTSSYVLFPNLTSTQRDALTPAAGMVIFNTTTTKLQVYAGGVWVDLH